MASGIDHVRVEFEIPLEDEQLTDDALRLAGETAVSRPRGRGAR